MSDDRTKIRLPPRVRLRAIDSATGSYPTIARVGDPDFQGNYPVSFNDMNTVIFHTGSMINYPTLLQVGSRFLNNDITSSLSTLGTVRKGIADELVSLTPGENLSPYNETRHPEIFGIQKEFYETGSSITNVGEGFGSPLKSKVKIEINLDPLSPTVFGCDKNGSRSQNLRQNFMVYYNFERKRWEGVGKGWDVTRSTVENISNPSTSPVFKTLLAETYDDAPIGFGPSMGFTLASQTSPGNYRPQDLSFYATLGRPVTNFGFPMHQKFHATSSQQLDVGQMISHPLLLEKLVYEFSASFEFDSTLASHDNEEVRILDVGGSDFKASNGQLTFMPTFFILNQRRPYELNEGIATTILRTSAVQSSISASINIPGKHRLTSGTIADPAPQIYVDTSRDLVTYHQMLIHLPATQSHAGATDYESILSSSTLIKAGLGRELNIIPSASSFFGEHQLNPFTGSFILSGTFKQTPKLTVTSPWDDYAPDSTFAGGIGGVVNARYTGGRTGTEMRVTGRDLVGTAIGDIPASGTAHVRGGLVGSDFDITPGTAAEQVSPYLIKPGDRLVFGWQAPISTRNKDMQNITGPNSKMVICPGKGKLILYGSLIREGQEFIDTRNPPLTSLAVHEDIHSNNPVLDQFDTEPRQQFSGTYIDEFVFGNMETTQNRVLRSFEELVTVPAVAPFTVNLTNTPIRNGTGGAVDFKGIARDFSLYSGTTPPTSPSWPVYGENPHGLRCKYFPTSIADCLGPGPYPLSVENQVPTNSTLAATYATGSGWDEPINGFPRLLTLGYRFTTREGSTYGYRNSEADMTMIFTSGSPGNRWEFSLSPGGTLTFNSELAGRKVKVNYEAFVITNSRRVEGSSANNSLLRSDVVVAGDNVPPILGEAIFANKSQMPGFSRCTAAIAENERYYDTLLPNIGEIVKINGTFPVQGGDRSVNVMFGENLDGGGTQTDPVWYRAFPFEAKYSRLKRQLNPIASVETDHDFGGVANASVAGHLKTIYKSDGTFLTSLVGFSDISKERDQLLHIYGIGDDVSGTVLGASDPFVNPTATARTAQYLIRGAVFRGFKYGIYSPLPAHSKALFRRSAFGQFRDMLEQRRDAKFFDPVGVKSDGTVGGTGARSAPVQVRFVKPRTNEITDPYTTFSSNMSIEATSSVPYFDGLDRNRSIPPDDDGNVNVTVTPMLTSIDLANNVIPKILLPPIVRRRIISPMLSARRTTGVLSLPSQLRLATPSLQLPQLRLPSVSPLPPALVKFRGGRGFSF